MILSIFHVFIDYLCIFIREIFIQIPRSFQNWFVFLLLSCKRSLYILDTSHLSDRISKSFLPFCGLSCHFLYGFLWNTKVPNFDEIQLTWFFFHCLCFWCHFKKSLPNSRSWRFIPMLCSKTFLVLALTFRSVIHFELIFVYVGRESMTSF